MKKKRNMRFGNTFDQRCGDTKYLARTGPTDNKNSAFSNFAEIIY